MPIWLHLLLTILSEVVCFFGGGFLGGLVTVLSALALQALGIRQPALSIVALVAGVILMPAAAYLGALCGAFAVNYFPARCPQCRRCASRGRPFNRYRVGAPITYACAACGHVHITWLRIGGSRG